MNLHRTRCSITAWSLSLREKKQTWCMSCIQACKKSQPEISIRRTLGSRHGRSNHRWAKHRRTRRTAASSITHSILVLYPAPLVTYKLRTCSLSWENKRCLAGFTARLSAGHVRVAANHSLIAPSWEPLSVRYTVLYSRKREKDSEMKALVGRWLIRRLLNVDGD